MIRNRHDRPLHPWMCVGLCAVVALLAGGVAAGPAARIDEAGVSLAAADGGVQVSVPLQRLASRAGTTMLEVSIRDENYQEVAQRKKRVFLGEERLTEEVLVPLDVDQDRLSRYSALVRVNGQQAFAGTYAYTGDIAVDVLGQEELAAGSTAALRVALSRSEDRSGVGGAEVRLRLVGEGGRTQELFRGATDDSGTVDARFRVPGETAKSATLRIEITRDGATQTIDQTVRIVDDTRILLTLDKPLYQPGQTMHIRALALHGHTLVPAASDELTLEVDDARGNKVFKHIEPTSDYGIVGADFVLADEVNEGRYKVRAILGDVVQERTVTVKTYVLPKFKIAVKTEKDSYLAGQTVKGHVQADYFFGKPVAKSAVRIVASAYDVGQQAFQTIEGEACKTNDTGRYEFSVELPDKLFGQPIFKGGTQVTFEVTVTDQAGHAEEAYHDITVSKDPLVIDAIAEAGTLVPGVDNEVYALVTYPDGRPATAELAVTVNGTAIGEALRTDELGFASFVIAPQGEATTLAVTATDANGDTATLEKAFQSRRADHALLLRTDLAAYQVGDVARIDVWGTNMAHETLFVDVIRDRQTLLTKSLLVENGHGHLDLVLDGSLFGTLQLSAYKILPNSEMVRDTRTVFVRKADELAIEYATDRPEYRPGEESELRVSVTDREGRGVPAAVGLDIVNESVFALSENKPGLLQQYFLMEEDLLQPRIQVRGFEHKDLVLRPLDTVPVPLRGGLLKMGLVQEEPPADAFSLRYDSRTQRREEVQAEGNALAVVLAVAAIGLSEDWTNVEQPLVARELVKQRDAVIDPWGLPYVARKRVQDQVDYIMVASAGPDGRRETADDIVIDQPAQNLLYGASYRYFGGGGGMEGRFRERLPARNFFFRSQSGEMRDDLLDGFNLAGALPVEHFDRAGRGVAGDRVIRGRMAVNGAVPPAVAAPMEPMVGFEALAELVEYKVAVDGSHNYAPIADDAPKSAAATELAAAVPPATQQEPVRVRSWFAETLYTNPAIITDSNGSATITLALADNITTWRMTGQANSVAGQLGSATASLRVFQPFFIDLDLPVALTQGDEVEIPVSVHNYLKDAQDVRVVLTQEDWFELVGGGLEHKVHVDPEEVTAVRYRIKAKELGDRALTVHGYGTQMSDAVKREIDVVPNGRENLVSVSDRLRGKAGHPLPETLTATVPENAIPGASKVLVTIHPGTFSQVLEGLQNIYRLPHGCFEQTSSITYPNVLVLDYMRRAEQITPELEITAKNYINIGYQRLVSYEVEGGGFQVWGQPPATRILTAYGLEQFYDMSKVHYVDPAVIDRTQQWLAAQQQADGTWKPDEQFVAHSEMWQDIANSNLVSTAYVAHALAYTGYQGEAIGKALAYLRAHAAEAKDAFSLVHLAEALVVMAPEDDLTTQVLAQLRGLATETKDEASWETKQTFSFACGDVATIEVTARAALVFMRAHKYGDVVNKALTYLLRNKDPHGTWQSTHATVQALKAFVQSMETATETATGTIRIAVNGAEVKALEITPRNNDVYHLIDAGEQTRAGDNEVSITLEGEGTLCYQVVTKYYTPWTEEEKIERESPMTIAVDYDRAELRTNETVTCNVAVGNRGPFVANMVMVDVGIPPGFEAVREDLEQLEQDKRIAKFSVSGRQASLYLDKLDAGQELKLSFKMKARYPITAKAPKSKVYQYYNPEVMALSAPFEVIVHD